MKVSILAFFWCILCINSFAQLDTFDTIYHWKYRLGFSLAITQNQPEATIANTKWGNEVARINGIAGHGVALGITADYHLFNPIILQSHPALSFYRYSLYYHKTNNTVDHYESIEAVTLELPIYIQLRPATWQHKPTIAIGPSFKTALGTEWRENQAIFWAMDIIFGLEEQLTFFDFAPEIRYSYGLSSTNLPQDPGHSFYRAVTDKLLIHTFSLILNFKG